MISKNEIQKIATMQKIGIDIVEKDYILSWILAGIHHHDATKNSWIFKGGTCLKKCYFETYRFSEDLDFTYVGARHEPTAKYYKDIFLEIAQWVNENSGIELPEQGIEFEVFPNPRSTMSVQGKLTYRGPIQRNVGVTRLPRIKIDLTLDEPLILEPQIKNVNHPYSDILEEGKKILAYSYEELFAEKLRALTQRLRPRDLYDVVHLFNQKTPDINLTSIRETLQKKCDHRSVSFPKIELIETHDNRMLLESEWETQLRHQMPVLPSFVSYMNELKITLSWISK